MTENWFEVLKAARHLADHGTSSFTAHALGEAAGFERTADSTVDKIAYGWLSKFLRWGYVRRVASEKGVSGRRVQTYTVTTDGDTCVPKEGNRGKLERLTEAVRGLERYRGTKHEAAAFASLIKICEEVERR
jgi:hypothetical protein